ncbi:hypothetical protein BJY17_002274 [Agromyces hippuratus]|uniref:Uncharacterized protein n=1 Tax=Agromyces hippuratus TaxID=286438 RepID=A0A852WV42_9MICO|nr:hypothetical protein [Agromyces hippuratus]NYG21527.1 hypothetical protein [Agromyces hippuratus]
MRKTVLFSAAVAALFIGSIFIGVAAATTGAPVLYDARSPQPVATGSDGFDVDAGEAQGGDQHAPVDGADTDGAPLPKPTPPPNATPRPTPAPTPTPNSTQPPAADPVPTPDEQQAWLGFQQLVRECMTTAGHEYREWEWWTTEPRDPTSTAPAMPEGLTADGEAAWRLALEGDGGENDGCLGEAVRADQSRPVVPPAAAPTPPTEAPTPAP